MMGAALHYLADEMPYGRPRGIVHDVAAAWLGQTGRIERAIAGSIDEHGQARTREGKLGVQYLNALKLPIKKGRAWLHDVTASHDDNPGHGDLVGNLQPDGVLILSGWASEQCSGKDTRRIVAALKEIGVDAKAGGKRRIGSGKSEIELRAIWIPMEAWRSTPGEDDDFDLDADVF